MPSPAHITPHHPSINFRYAPGRITNLGSAIPKTKGVPRFTVLNDFVACEEPDPNLVRACACACVGAGLAGWLAG